MTDPPPTDSTALWFCVARLAAPGAAPLDQVDDLLALLQASHAQEARAIVQSSCELLSQLARSHEPDSPLHPGRFAVALLADQAAIPELVMLVRDPAVPLRRRRQAAVALLRCPSAAAADALTTLAAADPVDPEDNAAWIAELLHGLEAAPTALAAGGDSAGPAPVRLPRACRGCYGDLIYLAGLTTQGAGGEPRRFSLWCCRRCQARYEGDTARPLRQLLEEQAPAWFDVLVEWCDACPRPEWPACRCAAHRQFEQRPADR